MKEHLLEELEGFYCASIMREQKLNIIFTHGWPKRGEIHFGKFRFLTFTKSLYKDKGAFTAFYGSLHGIG